MRLECVRFIGAFGAPHLCKTTTLSRRCEANHELTMNTLSATPGLRSRVTTLVLGVGVSLGLMAVFSKLWLFLFTKVACSFLLALAWVLLAALYRRGFRWFFSRRALRFHGCVVAGVISLIVLFYVEEGWRGKRAWTALQHELASRGEKLDVASVTPPPVPDDQNLAMAPVMARWLNYETNSSGNVRLGSRASSEVPNVRRLLLGGPDSQAIPQATWMRQEFTDLAAWQTYYRAPYVMPRWSVKSNRFVTVPREPTFPLAAEPQTPARDVLLALSKFDGSLDELARAAAERPLARFPQAYELGFFAQSSTHRALNDVVRVLGLRAVARLQNGQVDAAFADVQLAFRVADSPRQEPWLFSHTVERQPMLTDALQPVWEGLGRHQWSGPQLEALQQHFARMDFVAEATTVLRGEAVMQLDLIRRVRQFATGSAAELSPLRGAEGAGENFWSFALRWFYPIGWLYQDEVLTYRILKPFAQTGSSGEPPIEPSLASIMDPLFLTFLVPRLRAIREEAETRFPQLQTLVNEALVACALERYRIAHGQFPDRLESLVPGFMTELPQDVASHQPLRYRRTDDGRFVLYAMGSDGVDDGGKPAKVELDWTGSPMMRSGPGDWVWAYPSAAPGSLGAQSR